jgi:hypothetical protein
MLIVERIVRANRRALRLNSIPGKMLQSVRSPAIGVLRGRKI